MITYLTGPDIGPKSESDISNWDKKFISISTNKMIIEFKSDDFYEDKGFSANIYYTSIPNMECESWLDMNKKKFKSPTIQYHISNKCSWLITVHQDCHIMLDFIELYVRYPNIYTFRNIFQIK